MCKLAGAGTGYLEEKGGDPENDIGFFDNVTKAFETKARRKNLHCQVSAINCSVVFSGRSK